MREVEPGVRLVVGNGSAWMPSDEFDPIPLAPEDEAFLFFIGDNAESLHAQFDAVGAKVAASLGKFEVVTIKETEIAAVEALEGRRERLVFVDRAGPLNDVTIRKPKAEALKQTMVDSVNPSAHLEQVKVLSGAVGFPLDGVVVYTHTRYSYSTQNMQAARYIQQTFADLGLETMIQPFTVGGRETRNIIGIKRGTGSPNDIVVVGAHYDSTSQSPQSNAPGAVDDASGTAAVLQMAKIFSQYNTAKTIHFVLFSGEEQGLYGSKYYVSRIIPEDWYVSEALIMDMISYSNKHFGVVVESTKSYMSLIELADFNFRNFSGNGLTVATSTYSFGSDHVSFQEAGIPAFLAIERDETEYPYYHRTGDTWENISTQQSESIMRGMVATLYDLASPSLPK
eukprot:TRINITY_DN22953_c0_g1_i1.p1 TRINITY_DN22953_c0_g1~~TRINITY_DN22953_c0_g1_i1.p1  ORF type:complete len:456 (-),score=133.87 TRINITY_DN22953_c0_g1_i1:581-1768(-)